jgi:hypothetical protein
MTDFENMRNIQGMPAVERRCPAGIQCSSFRNEKSVNGVDAC